MGAELLDRDVAKGADFGQSFLQQGHPCLALLAANVVLGPGQLALDSGVANDDAGIAGGERHRLVGQRPAIEKQGMARLAKAGDELVHDPAVHADEVVLRALAEQGHLLGPHLEPKQALKGERGHHLQRGR